jgi:hypothetical protein
LVIVQQADAAAALILEARCVFVLWGRDLRIREASLLFSPTIIDPSSSTLRNDAQLLPYLAMLWPRCAAFVMPRVVCRLAQMVQIAACCNALAA